MINVYSVLVKPSYKLKHVERLYNLVLNNFSHQFTFNCLTDSEYQSIYPINFINVSSYQLDTWWNKVLLFDKTISGPDINLYFDLDINILGNIDFLLDSITDTNVSVVDTVWKNENYFNINKKSQYARFKDAYFSYGNSSLLGWKGNSHQFLIDMLLDNPMHTVEHFGDDTFINKYGKVNYFQQKIQTSIRMNKKDIADKRIIIHYKDLP